MTKIIANAFAATVLSLAVLSTSGTASAQEDDGNVTTYDFDDDLVTGDLMRPDGEQLISRSGGKRFSLIRIREHFVPEMLKSVADL